LNLLGPADTGPVTFLPLRDKILDHGENRGDPMNLLWLALGLVFGYLFFKLEFHPPYGGIFSNPFAACLERVDEYLQAEPGMRLLMEDPADPEVWKKRMKTKSGKFMNLVGLTAFTVFVGLLLNMVSRDLKPHGLQEGDSLEALAVASAVAPLFWLWGRARTNGLIQGYIDGYIAGFNRAKALVNEEVKGV
jgi:hypothetical protein